MSTTLVEIMAVMMSCFNYLLFSEVTIKQSDHTSEVIVKRAAGTHKYRFNVSLLQLTSNIPTAKETRIQTRVNDSTLKPSAAVTLENPLRVTA